MIEQCYKKHKTVVNPIIEWTDDDVWDFIKANSIPYCELYDEGWKRLGCIGCPMSGKHGREKQFARWEKYKYHYLLAFDRMLKELEKKGHKTAWQTSKDVFNWWMEYDVLPGQVDWFEEMQEEW